MRRELGSGAVIGVSGAASVALVEHLVGRVASLNGNPIARGASRLLLGGLLAAAAERLGASSEAVTGVWAGPVLVTSLDVGAGLLARRRVDPPEATTADEAGAPWAPRPLWAM